MQDKTNAQLELRQRIAELEATEAGYKRAEEALRESEALYQSLVKALPMSLCRKDRQGRIIFANRRYCDEFGLSQTEMAGKTDYDLHPPELAAKYLRDDLEVIETGRTIELVEEHAPLGGELIYVQVFKSPIRDASGQISGVQIMFWDITERKRLEKQLVQSEEQYRNLVEQSAEGIWLLAFDEPIRLDLPAEEQVRRIQQQGYVAECNDALARMYGYPSRREMLGKRLLELYGGTPNEQNLQATLHLVSSGYQSNNRETREVNSQGETVYFSNNAVGIIKDKTLTGIWGAQRDITERKRAEELLKERVLFETLLSDLSSRFVNLPASEMDEAIRQGLRMIIEFLDADRGSLVEFRDDQTRRAVTYAYARPDIPQAPIARPNLGWPTWRKQIHEGKFVAFGRVDDLPPEAAEERQAALAAGLKSFLAIPLLVENAPIGYMAFPSFQREHAWPQTLLPRLKLVGEIFANAIARKRTEELLHERILFETLLSNLSARFVNLPAGEMDEAIRQGLRMIVEFLDADRGSLMEFRDGQTQRTANYSYTRPDVPQAPIARADLCWPWWGKKMRAGEIIAFEQVDDLPPEAAVERQVALEVGLKSYLAIPLLVENALIGYITFPSYQHERAWPQTLLPRLKLIGEIFANALARKRAEELLRERVLFETLLSDLSARFVNLPAEEIDEALEYGLRMIVEFLDVDRGSLVELSDDLAHVMLISAYARPNIPAVNPGHAVREWQGWAQRLREGRIIAVERTDELPAEAGRERDDAIAVGLKSYLAVPLSVGHATLGFMAFLAFRHERIWPQELIPRLQIIGQVFANAVVRKRAEEELRQSNAELQARNEELDAFAHTVAHDLKNPVALMMLSADVLQEEGTRSDEEAKEIMTAISHSAHKMDSIIEELLLLSQVRKADVQTQPLDMDNLVQEACRRLAQMSAKSRVEITRPAASAWPVALGYGPWIEEVWVNYISNAIKYGGKPPHVELGAELAPQLPPHARRRKQAEAPPLTSFPRAGGTERARMARFWVRDNGAGIAPEEQARLFEVFERLDQVRVSGHGLGLSIVKRIVERLGGQVGVESRVGEGSTFYFTLPAAPPGE